MVSTGPEGVAVDGSGNVFVADTSNNMIVKITAAGLVSTLAGSSAFGNWGSANGTGSAARFNGPTGVAVDGSGNVFVADKGNHTIRKVTPSGVVTTLAGSAGNSGSVNGTGAGARFNGPTSLALDQNGNIYVADYGNHLIRKVTSSGVVTTFAGSSGQPGEADGIGGNARLNFPNSVAMDGSGNLYVADSGHQAVRKVTPSGMVSTIATEVFTSAGFNSPSGIAVDSSGNVYMTKASSHVIRRITPHGGISTIGGSLNIGGAANGSGSAARFNEPTGLSLGPDGSIYVADRLNALIRRGVSVEIESQIELCYHETSTAFQFLIIDEATDDKIVVTTGKKKGGFATRVKRVDYYFGSSLHESVPAGSRVRFSPNLNGLPASISGLSRQATTTFAWKADLSSVKITTGSSARRGAQKMPGYLKSMVDGDFLGEDTVSAAALNGKLASWLAEVVDTTSTWAYAAAEVSVDGFGEEGVYPNITMDPRYFKWHSLAHYACRFIGGLRPDQISGASGFAAVPQSSARKAFHAAEASPTAMTAPNATGVSPIPSFRPFGEWNFRGVVAALQADFRDAIVSFLRRLNTKTWADDGPIRNRILNESLIRRSNPSSTDVDRGRLVFMLFNNEAGGQDHFYRIEGGKAVVDVWREGGTAGFLAAEVLLGSEAEMLPGTNPATYGKDFTVSGRVFRFKSGETNNHFRPRRVNVSLLKDRITEQSESFALHLRNLYDGGEVLSTVWGKITDVPVPGNTNLVYRGLLPTSYTMAPVPSDTYPNRTYEDAKVTGEIVIRYNKSTNSHSVTVIWYLRAVNTEHSQYVDQDFSLSGNNPGPLPDFIEGIVVAPYNDNMRFSIALNSDSNGGSYMGTLSINTPARLYGYMTNPPAPTYFTTLHEGVVLGRE